MLIERCGSAVGRWNCTQHLNIATAPKNNRRVSVQVNLQNNAGSFAHDTPVGASKRIFCSCDCLKILLLFACGQCYSPYAFVALVSPLRL
jgi:hypothetical protein